MRRTCAVPIHLDSDQNLDRRPRWKRGHMRLLGVVVGGVHYKYQTLLAHLNWSDMIGIPTNWCLISYSPSKLFI